MSKKSGFTIVELLIVIVVIAILAAITIVAYQGIQDRANQSKTVTALSEYAKALSSYAVVNNAYPVGRGCLGWQGTGTTLKCINASGINGAACFSLGQGNSTLAFNDAITPYIGSNMPTLSDRGYDCGGTQYTGGYYYRADDVSPAYIYLFISSSTADCPTISGLSKFSNIVQEGARRCLYQVPIPS